MGTWWERVCIHEPSLDPIGPRDRRSAGGLSPSPVRLIPARFDPHRGCARRTVRTMTMKPITGAAAVALTFALAACGGSGHSSSSGPKYADPNALLAKVTAAGFQCDPQGGPATYNAAGALSLSCIHGSADETVYLDTFPSSSAKAADVRLNTSAATSYVGANWGVFTQSASSVAALRQILVGGQ